MLCDLSFFFFQTKLNFLEAGFRPRRRVPFVSAKGTKTIFARAQPYGCLRLHPE